MSSFSEQKTGTATAVPVKVNECKAREHIYQFRCGKEMVWHPFFTPLCQHNSIGFYFYTPVVSHRSQRFTRTDSYEEPAACLRNTVNFFYRSPDSFNGIMIDDQETYNSVKQLILPGYTCYVSTNELGRQVVIGKPFASKMKTRGRVVKPKHLITQITEVMQVTPITTTQIENAINPVILKQTVNILSIFVGCGTVIGRSTADILAPSH